jgi:hypothetical protein
MWMIECISLPAWGLNAFILSVSMNRISFRQGMLLGFALIVFLLGGAAVQSWLVVERLLSGAATAMSRLSS